MKYHIFKVEINSILTSIETAPLLPLEKLFRSFKKTVSYQFRILNVHIGAYIFTKKKYIPVHYFMIT